MLLAIAVLFGVACVAASARRLVVLVRSTALDPDVLARAVTKTGGVARVRRAIADLPANAWERRVALALSAPLEARSALVNEQLTELDFEMQQWQRVPRVCASIATSVSFLLATLSLRVALADVGDGVTQEDLNQAIAGAIAIASTGLAATSFCIAIQFRARGVAKRRLASADKVVERLEAASLEAADAVSRDLATQPISENIRAGLDVRTLNASDLATDDPRGSARAGGHPWSPPSK